MEKSDSTPAASLVAPGETLVFSIIEIRGERVILDQDLAKVYGVETKRLNQQVKRNADKFGEKHVFQLTPEEHESLRLQSATSKIQHRLKCGVNPFGPLVIVDQATKQSIQRNIANMSLLTPRDISRDSLFRALKVNLEKAAPFLPRVPARGTRVSLRLRDRLRRQYHPSCRTRPSHR